jgi:hypothetical protein
MTRKSVWTNADGLKVGFGPNVSDFDSVGMVDHPGGERELRFVIDGEKFSGGAYQFQESVSIPAGSVPLYAHVQVSEVFALGGTTPTITFGDAGSATRYGSLSEANAEALGTYTLSVTATPTTAAGTLAIALGGTTPTVTSAGKAEVVIGYRIV